mgnify:CR=1 FL=1
MSCNSCSNITLPGSAGVAGPQGPAGADGTPGPAGPAGSAASVIDIDFQVYDGAVPNFPTVAQKVVTIPAHTWQNEQDTIELEMMFETRGKVASGAEASIKIKVDGSDLDLYTANTNNQLDFFTDLGVSPSFNNIVKVRLQLPMFVKTGRVGRMRPVIQTDVFTGTNGGQEYYSLSTPAKSIYGRSTQLLAVGDVGTAVPIEVYMRMNDGYSTALPFKMVYYKLLSYKKIV